MVRILHVCQPTDGGAAVVVRELVDAGIAAGDEVTVACPRGGYLSDWVNAAGAHWVPLPMERSPGPRDLISLIRLRPLLAEADVMHLHSQKAGMLGRMAMMTRRTSQRKSTRTRTPRVVFTPHGWVFYGRGRSGFIYRQFERRMAFWTEVITVSSAEELQDGRRIIGERATLELVENGVDNEQFSPDGPVAEREPAPLLVQVGRLSRQKGQDRTLRALALLRDEQIRLRFVGDGPEQSALEQLAGDLDLAKRVEFVGSVDPRPHLRAADLVVLPSRWEGMSLVLLEAMSVGTTIVSSHCGGSDALIGCGVVVEAVDDDAAISGLVKEISQLLADLDRRRSMAEAARRKACQRYSLDRTLGRYRTLYQGASGPGLS
jgi:glycosyltransferase involved in cell wall biosynthesis